jgi:ketosteroid isomerase-like protein
MKGIVLFISVIVLLACNNRNTVNVQDLNKQFISAWNNKDSAKIDSFLSADVQFLQADNHYKGKTEVVQKWVKAGIPVVSSLKTSVVSTDADENMAYEAGTFSVDLLIPNQPVAIGEGNYLFIWKKQADASWKVNYVQLEDLPVRAGGR